MQEMIAFWLLPAAEDSVQLQRVIDHLAQRYQAPRFEPHVTVGTGALGAERAAEILRQLSVRRPITLRSAGCQFSADYTRTLFLQFESNREIAALAAELQAATGSRNELDPHLSLIYCDLPLAEKAEIARHIALPDPHITFDRLKVIRTPVPITSRAEVEAWTEIATRSLATPD